MQRLWSACSSCSSSSSLANHDQCVDDFTRLTALVYVTEFIEIGGAALLPHGAALLRGVVPSVAHSSDNIAGAAIRANDALLALLRAAPELEPYLGALLDALLALLDARPADAPAAPIPAKLAALRWLAVLHARAPGPLGLRHAELLPPLLEAACGASELLARRALGLLATLADDAARLDALLAGVVRRLARDAALLDNRGALVVRQLCVRVPPERVLRRIALILESEENLEFAAVMVDTLNLILLTAPELAPARRKLRDVASPDAADFFSALYRCWSHSPAALLCLCLLCGVYEHAAALIMLL
jgi:vacuole morphology and inheritance protein 14